MQPRDDPSTIWVVDDQGIAPEELGAVVSVLIAEFAGRIQAPIVIAQVVLACQQLFDGGVLAGLGPATTSLARARLRALAASEGAE